MKKALILMVSFAMIATLALTGCNKEQKALDALGTKICADNGKAAGSILFSKTMFEFMTRAQTMGEGAKPEEVEKGVEEALKMFDMMKDEMSKEVTLATCSAKAETMKCEDAYKEIAASDAGKGIKDAEKTLAAVGEKMGLKNCGKLAVTGKEKEGDKEETGTAFVAKVGEEYMVFFLQEPK